MLRTTKAIGLLICSFSSACWSSGFYAGIGVGPDMASIRANATVIDGIQGNFLVKNQTHIASTGIFGTIFGGYGYNLDQYWTDYLDLYVGFELNANLSSLASEEFNKDTIHKSYAHSKYTIKQSYGASLLPGFDLTDTTLFYIRAGYANGRFKVETSDVSLTNIDKNLNGFRYGIGIEHILNNRLDLRMEYSNTFYSAVSVFTLDANSGVTKETDFAPQTGQVDFSLVYSF